MKVQGLYRPPKSPCIGGLSKVIIYKKNNEGELANGGLCKL